MTDMIDMRERLFNRQLAKLMAVVMVLFIAVAPTRRVSAQDTATIVSRVQEWVECANYVIPVAGYYYTASYPVGIYTGVMPGIGGWIPLRVGWNCHSDKTFISETEYRVPTWTIQFSELFGIAIDRDWTALYGLLGGIDMGVDFVRKCIVEPNTGRVLEKETVPYFSFTPKVGFSWVIFDFIVGYEFVPAYQLLSGWTFGVGFSMPTH